VPSLPAAPASPGTPGYFTGGNPGLGQGATVPGYEWFNAVQEELMAVILRGGITGSNADLAQVRKSLDRLFGGSYSYINASSILNPDQTGLVWADSSSGPITLTLPANNSLNARPMRYRILGVGANPVTIQRQGSDNINFQTSLILAAPGDCVDIMGTGDGAWVAIGSIPATTSKRGIVRFATVAEAVAGSADNLAVTPAGLGALLTGMIAFFPATAAPTGWLKANGALVSRATFFNLWAVAQASGNLVTDAAWLAANGPTGAFSQGDGSTTFRIPDLRGEFLRGLDDGRGMDTSRNVGSVQKGSLVVGEDTSVNTVNNALLGNAAALSAFGLEAPDLTQYAGATVNTATSGAAQSLPINHAGVIRPRNIALLACIKF
jgi:microcystin-dependent protein